MKLRYEVVDEYNESIRFFATKHEAEAHCKLDMSFYIKVHQRVKPNPFKEAYTRLGPCLF